jgi:hypothetical protein
MPNTYTDTPIASHTLAADQPTMEANFLYLANTLGTTINASKDHQISQGGIDTNAFEGRHRQVSFNQQTAASVIPAFSDGASAVLFSSSAANGNLSVTFPSYGAVGTQLTVSAYPPVNGLTLGSSGRTWLAGGMQMIWGSFNPNSSTIIAFPFSGFPNAVMNIQLTGSASNNSTFRNNLSTGTVSKTGFTWQGTVDSHYTPIYYLAIGY